MNSLYKIYCRTFQTVLHLALPLLPYHEPKLYNNINLAVYDETKAIPLYPVPKLMDKDELKKFYYQLLE